MALETPDWTTCSRLDARVNESSSATVTKYWIDVAREFVGLGIATQWVPARDAVLGFAAGLAGVAVLAGWRMLRGTRPWPDGRNEVGRAVRSGPPARLEPRPARNLHYTEKSEDRRS